MYWNPFLISEKDFTKMVLCLIFQFPLPNYCLRAFQFPRMCQGSICELALIKLLISKAMINNC